MSGNFPSELAAEIYQHQQTKEQLHAVLDAMPGTVSWLAADLTYLGVNRLLAHYCNLAPEAFIGRPLGFLNPEGNQFTQFVRQFFADPQKTAARTEITRGRSTFLTVAQKYNHGQAAVFIEIDISDRKAIEAQLEAANQQYSQANLNLAQATVIKDEMLANMANIHAELARATRLKDEFLASMSHELRTPLNAVLGMSEALLDELCGGLEARQRRAIEAIAQSGQHLLELINDILDLAKIESGKLELQCQVVPIAGLLQSSVDCVRQLATARNITISTQIDPSVDSVWLDDRRFRQVLINLLSNAIKFTLDGGAVSLRVAPGRERSGVCFTVADTGIGIAPEHLPQLFEPFVQIDSRLNRQYAGTGMGLALVRRIVELHQGKVRVISEVGQGSQFILEGPWECSAAAMVSDRRSVIGPLAPALTPRPSPRPAEAELLPAIAPPSHNAAAKRILIADDNVLNTYLFSEYLQEEGYQVVLARNGQEALASLQQTACDLVIMDIQMPVMDGLTTIGQLRQQDQFQHLPIIALTALAMPGDQQRCLQAGATEYMSKPVQLKHLTHRIQHWLTESDVVAELVI
jgi:signal transduction histidine kinase/ActR/RegA family two-component response regulator